MKTKTSLAPAIRLLGPLVLLATHLAAAGPADETSAYLAQVHQRIHPRWESFLLELHRAGPPYQNPALATELVLVVEPDGTVSRIEQPARSGLKGFDDAPVDLIHDAGRMPPPPPALRSDDGRAYLRWRFSRRSPGCENRDLVRRQLPLMEAIPYLAAAGRGDEAAARVRAALQADPAQRLPLLTNLVEALGRAGAASGEPKVRAAAAGVLALVPDGEPGLLKLARDPEGPVRRAALQALGQRTLTPAARPVLKQALADDERAGAALLLHRLGDDSGIAPLRAALADGSQPGETAAALKELGDQKEAAAIAARLLADGHTYMAGVQAARGLSDPALCAPLLKYISAAPESVRQTVLEAFGALGAKATPEARKYIFRSLTDPSPEVRRRALAAAGTLGDHSPGLRYRLIDALADPVPPVRAAATGALVEAGGEAAKDELLRGLRDRAPEVRLALYQALQAHPFPSARPLISKLHDDPEVTRAATEPDEAALGARLLEAADPVERLRAAAEWLRRAHPPVSSASATPG